MLAERTKADIRKAVREMLKDMGIDITELQDVSIEIEDDGK